MHKQCSGGCFAYGVQGAIGSMTIIAALGLVLCSLSLYKHHIKDRIPIEYSSDIWREWPMLLTFSLPSMLSAFMMAPAIWSTNSILVNQPKGYAELGLFNAANQWGNMLMVIPALMSSAILPILSETFGNEDKADFKRMVTFNIHTTWIVALPLTVSLATFGFSLSSLYGQQFHAAAPMIAILMVATFLNIVNWAIGSAFAGSGRMWTGSVMNFGWAITLVATAYFMIPILGGKGLAFAFLISYFVHTLWQMAYLELRIARFAVTIHWKLAIFTLLLFVLCIAMSLYHCEDYVLSSIVSVISAVPLLIYVRTKTRQHRLIEV